MNRQQRFDRRWRRRYGYRYQVEVYGVRITRLRDAALAGHHCLWSAS